MHDRYDLLGVLKDDPVWGPTVHLGEVGIFSLILCGLANFHHTYENCWLLLVQFDGTLHHLA